VGRDTRKEESSSESGRSTSWEEMASRVKLSLKKPGLEGAPLPENGAQGVGVER
jgi:hypothetical protein